MSLSQEHRARLNYAFAHHVITTFSNSKAAYVQPFLQPVNVDDVPDYHDVVERPMDLSTILKDLERNKYTQLSDVKASFDLMFNNCFLYNPSRSVSDVYMKGWNFQRAFWTAWSKKDHWINAHAAQLSESSEEDEESINSKNFLQDDEQATDDNESDGVTHEDDGTPESDRPAVRRSSRVLRQNEVTGNNIIGKPWKAARKKHGGKYLLATRKPARDHDVSIKRTRLARKAAIRSTLQDHVSDSAESSQDEQSPTHENQTEHEAQQSHPSPEPEEKYSTNRTPYVPTFTDIAVPALPALNQLPPSTLFAPSCANSLRSKSTQQPPLSSTTSTVNIPITEFFSPNSAEVKTTRFSMRSGNKRPWTRSAACWCRRSWSEASRLKSVWLWPRLSQSRLGCFVYRRLTLLLPSRDLLVDDEQAENENDLGEEFESRGPELSMDK